MLPSHMKRSYTELREAVSAENILDDDRLETATNVSTVLTAQPSTVITGTTLRKGLLWQQRDKLFSRWKERFFILTADYLQCFKKASSRISEMGGFIFKLRLSEVRLFKKGCFFPQKGHACIYFFLGGRCGVGGQEGVSHYRPHPQQGRENPIPQTRGDPRVVRRHQGRKNAHT